MVRTEGSFAGRRMTRIIGPGVATGFIRGKKNPVKGMAEDSDDILKNLGVNRMD